MPRVQYFESRGGRADRYTAGGTARTSLRHSGGSVDIYTEPQLPAPRLVVFGADHPRCFMSSTPAARSSAARLVLKAVKMVGELPDPEPRVGPDHRFEHGLVGARP